MTSKTMFRRNGDLPFQTMADEAVVVNPGTREVHVLNGSGARIWALLAAEQTVDELCVSLETEFEAEADALRSEVGDFVRDLVAKALVTERPARAR